MLVHKIVAITPIPTSTMGKFSVVRPTTWRVIFDIRLRTQGATKPIKHLVASTARTALVNNNAYDAARRSLRNPIKCFDQAASTAAFRFLRHPRRPNALRPVAKSGERARKRRGSQSFVGRAWVWRPGSVIAKPRTEQLENVRFGSKADMSSAKGHVRSTPESGHVQCTRYVRLVPIADIGNGKKAAIGAAFLCHGWIFVSRPPRH